MSEDMPARVEKRTRRGLNIERIFDFRIIENSTSRIGRNKANH